MKIRVCMQCKGIIVLNGDFPYWLRGVRRKRYWCDKCLQYWLTLKIRKLLPKTYTRAWQYELSDENFLDSAKHYEHYEPKI